MTSFRPRSAETLEDRERYTRALLTEVACQDCLARVGVQKNSDHHTSIQWSAEARAHCHALSGSRAPRADRTYHVGCPRLAASIEAAVRDGRLPIGLSDVL